MLRAIHFPDRDAFVAQELAGSTHFDFVGATIPGAEATLWVRCPGGTGELCRLFVARALSRESVNVMIWNGSMSDPNLLGPLRLSSGWHGYLRDGYWEAV